MRIIGKDLHLDNYDLNGFGLGNHIASGKHNHTSFILHFCTVSKSSIYSTVFCMLIYTFHN